MTILDRINAYKKQEVAAKKAAIPVSVLEQTSLFHRATHSLTKSILAKPTGIIAEHKRRSPSKAVINDQVALPEVIQGYDKAGVAGISVLTDTKYFGGSLDDLVLARTHTKLPILRKDFMIDPYQILEAKAHGADVILLIAASLSASQLSEFSSLAKELGLEVLLEVHNTQELEKSLLPTVDLIGVNNRNLKTFEVSLDISKELSAQIPDTYVKISESGISEVSSINHLKEFGYRGFLVGERFMKDENPGVSAQNFLAELV